MDTGYLRTLTNGLQLKYMKCITHSKAFQGQYSAFIYINLIHDAVYIQNMVNMKMIIRRNLNMNKRQHFLDFGQ